jgi:stage II sporulation protein AA (anti-sigma F factor antagonist)
MEYKFEISDGTLRVSVPRELDHHCATQLKEEADLLIDAYHVRYLVFDFARTEFMDSSGIGVLIGRSRNLSFAGGRVAAANLSPRVEQIFHLSGLHRMITVLPKEDTGNEKSHDSFF